MKDRDNNIIKVGDQFYSEQTNFNLPQIECVETNDNTSKFKFIDAKTIFTLDQKTFIGSCWKKCENQ